MNTIQQPDGAPPSLAYQPQHLWSDGEFDLWANIGMPTISKRVTRTRLELFLGLHPGDKVRVLKIVSSAEVIDAAEFLGQEPAATSAAAGGSAQGKTGPAQAVVNEPTQP